MPKQVNLSFAGSITKIPTIGAIKVCEWAGHTFYLSGHGFNSFFNSEFNVAWMVKVLNPKPEKDEPKEKEKCPSPKPLPKSKGGKGAATPTIPSHVQYSIKYML